MLTHRTSSSPRRASGRVITSWTGFTLVELMISVALVLVLILGVNEIFRLTSETIGVGQSLSTALRDQRAARTIMTDDFNNIAPDGPAIVIVNQAVSAFRNQGDKLASIDPTNPTIQDLNNDGDTLDAGEAFSPAVPGNRIYRTDQILFFVRRKVKRQTGNLSQTTGNPTDILGSASSDEALVHYGHARLPDNSGADRYWDPGERGVPGGVQNDNNQFATQWVLGRRQMVLVPSLSRSSSETFWRPTPSGTSALNLSPLSMSTNARNGAGGELDVRSTLTTSGFQQVGNFSPPKVLPWESKNDLAYISIPEFARKLGEYERDVLMDQQDGVANIYASPLNNGYWYLPAASTAATPGTDTYTAARATQTLMYRTNVNPFGRRDFDAATGVDNLATTLAQTSPVFLGRCTQFIVEYAGDFITQDTDPSSGGPNTYGLATAVGADGEIDFVVDIRTGAKRIRWYGLPRYTNSGMVDAASSSTTYVGPVVAGLPMAEGGTPPEYSQNTALVGGVRDTRFMPDVVPLSDIIAAINNSNNRRSTGTPPVNYFAPFEKVIMSNATSALASAPYKDFYSLANPNSAVLLGPTDPATFLPPQENYADAIAAAFTPNRANYVCAWSGGGPKMVRIIITLEDPGARAGATPQTYEFVYSLPY